MTSPAELRAHREKRGLTQEQAGAEMGVRGETVSRWETGAVPVPKLVLYWIRQGGKK